MTYKHKVDLMPKIGQSMYGLQLDAATWCSENFGRRPQTHRWSIIGVAATCKFRFRFKKDAVLFALRWA